MRVDQLDFELSSYIGSGLLQDLYLVVVETPRFLILEGINIIIRIYWENR